MPGVPPKGHTKAPRRDSLIAIAEMERLGLNPIKMLAEVFREAMDGYRSGRGITEKADSGAAWLAVAGKAAADLCSYKHPKLSAIALADLTKDAQAGAREAVTTERAIEIFKADPFAPERIKGVDTKDVISQMNSIAPLQDALPIGNGDVPTK